MAETKTKKEKTGGIYFEAVGRRKTAVARVRVVPEAAKASFVVNGRPADDYFPLASLQKIIREALSTAGLKTASVSVKVSGSGIAAQAEAVRLGIARALIKHDANLRASLKKEGFLKRDPRKVERKKFGKKKARKSPQWSKR